MPSSDDPIVSGHYPTRSERIADLWVHVIGVGLAVIGGAALVVTAYLDDGVGRALSVCAYVLCLLTMLGVSAASNLATIVYHHRRLQNLDQAAIFLMIAGSYTPFTTQILHGPLGIGMTLAVWCLALVAAAGKLFLPGISRRLWMLAYLLLGWMVVIAIVPLVAGLRPASLILLLGGGITYSLGAIFYAAPSLRFRRAIWHGFVLAAAAMHFCAILTGVVLA
jgi:hemolysin III